MRAGMLLLMLAFVPACATTGNSIASPKSASATKHAPTDVSRIIVTTSNDPQRPSEVVALLDTHTDADTEDKGFDELRAKAASLGADAVISADFDHGDSGGSLISPASPSATSKRFRPTTCSARSTSPATPTAKTKGSPS